MNTSPAHQRYQHFTEALAHLLEPGSLATSLQMLTLVDLLRNYGYKDIDSATRISILTRIHHDASAWYLEAWASSKHAVQLSKDWLRDALTPSSKFRPTLLAALQLFECLPVLERQSWDVELLNLMEEVRNASSSSQGEIDAARWCMERWGSAQVNHNSSRKDSDVNGDATTREIPHVTNPISPPSPSIPGLDSLFSSFDVQDISVSIEAALRMVIAEQSQQSEDHFGMSILYTILRKVVSTQKYHQHIMALEGEEAQLLLDSLQLVLDYPTASPVPDRRQLLKALLRLSRKTELSPTCLTLGQVEESGQPLSAGHFGEIYKGRFQGRDVALKVVKVYSTTEMSKVKKAVFKEGIIWSQLSHRNILPFYGIHDNGSGHLAMVSPWMQNGNVTQYLSLNPHTNRLLLLSDIASGMACLHENDVIHGDLKGVNILVTPSGHACLADFGLAKLSDSEALSWTNTYTSGGQGGTVRWQAPELFDPEDDSPKMTVKTDIYSFACVCYEIMFSLVPFYEYPREATVIMKVMAGQKPSKPSLSAAKSRSIGYTKQLWELIEDCWNTEPSLRPEAIDILGHGVLAEQDDTRANFTWDRPSRFDMAIATLSSP